MRSSGLYGPASGHASASGFYYVVVTLDSGSKNQDLFTLTYDGGVCSAGGLSVANVEFHYHMTGSSGSLGRLRLLAADGTVVT